MARKEKLYIIRRKDGERWMRTFWSLHPHSGRTGQTIKRVPLAVAEECLRVARETCPTVEFKIAKR